MNDVLMRLQAIEDELIKQRKQRNYELNNLDEDNIPRLKAYSQLISENQAAVSEVKQEVSDTKSTVTLLSQYTDMSDVVVVESSDDKSKWDTLKVYYDSKTKTYFYHDGSKWNTTTSPITAKLDTSIAQIQATADDASASATLLAQYTSMNNVVNVTSNTNTSWDKTKTYYNTSTKKYWYYDGVSKTWVNTTAPITAGLSSNVAQIKTTADNASASVETIVSNIGSDGSVTAASVVAKINAAGSAVQISADHISLKGKTIALTTDEMSITSSNFNVSSTGSMTLTGSESSINVHGSSYSSSIIQTTFSSGGAPYRSIMSPNGFASYYGNDVYIGSINDGGIVHSWNQGFARFLASISGTSTVFQNTSYQNATLSVDTVANQVIIGGSLVVYGTTNVKNKVNQTESYGDKTLYCVESPSPYYSDYGRGTISEDGMLSVWLDPVFVECIDQNYDYFVQITLESAGNCYVSERYFDHFTVKGEPGTQFAFTVTAPQNSLSAQRLESFTIPEEEDRIEVNQENVNYDSIGDSMLIEYNNQIF